MSNSDRLRIAPALLLKNAALSVGGDLALAIIALVTLPILLRHMGSARFGVFSLIWLVLAYFTIADLGLGRAIVRFVSKILGEQQCLSPKEYVHVRNP